MAIPGSYHPPEVPGTTPAPTPTPTPTPTPGGGNGWWARLFGDTANLPDWLRQLLGGTGGGGTMPQPNQPATTTGFGWGRPYNPHAPAWDFPTQTGPYVPHGWAAKFIPAGAFQPPQGGGDATTPGSPDGTVGAADWERLRRMGLVNGGTAASAAGGGSALLGGGGGGTAAASTGGGGTGLGSSGGSGWASFFGLR